VSDTVSRQLQQALSDTLQAHLPDFIPAAANAHFYLQEEEFSAIRCPGVFVFDRGWTKEFESIRGIDGAGNVKPGIVQRRYSFDVQLYLKGRQSDSLRKDLQAWADAVTAVVETQWALGLQSAEAQAKSGDPQIVLDEESSVLMVSQVQVTADVWLFQGTTDASSSSSSSSSASSSSSSWSSSSSSRSSSSSSTP
jgi:hypothetical protein